MNLRAVIAASILVLALSAAIPQLFSQSSIKYVEHVYTPSDLYRIWKWYALDGSVRVYFDGGYLCISSSAGSGWFIIPIGFPVGYEQRIVVEFAAYKSSIGSFYWYSSNSYFVGNPRDAPRRWRLVILPSTGDYREESPSGIYFGGGFPRASDVPVYNVSVKLKTNGWFYIETIGVDSYHGIGTSYPVVMFAIGIEGGGTICIGRVYVGLNIYSDQDLPTVAPFIDTKTYVVRAVERSGKDLVDYPIKVVLTTGSLIDWDSVLPGCTNMWFTDGSGNPLYYWVEYCDMVNKKIVAWVKVPYLQASSSVRVYMYLGDSNPYESFRDPNNVFLYFNDFRDSSFSYVVIGGSWSIDTVGAGFLRSTSSGSDNWIYIPVSFARPVAMGFLMVMGNSDAGGGFIWGSAGGGESSVSGYIPNYYTSTTYSQLRRYSSGSSTNLAGLPALSSGSIHRVELMLGSSRVIVVRNDAVDASAGDTTFTTLSGIGFRINRDTRSIDYVFVRPYADPDPEVYTAVVEFTTQTLTITATLTATFTETTTATITSTQTVTTTQSVTQTLTETTTQTVTVATTVYTTEYHTETKTVTSTIPVGTTVYTTTYQPVPVPVYQTVTVTVTSPVGLAITPEAVVFIAFVFLIAAAIVVLIAVRR